MTVLVKMANVTPSVIDVHAMFQLLTTAAYIKLQRLGVVLQQVRIITCIIFHVWRPCTVVVSYGVSFTLAEY